MCSIVREVNIKKSGRRPGNFSVALIGRDRFEIGIDCILPAPATNVDVRRHVHIVREPRLKFPQAICGRERTLRMWGSLHRMNVEMVREWMLRIQLQHRIQRRENFVRAGIWLTFRRPLIPRPQIHHRFGEKDADVLIVRVFSPKLAHRIGISLIQRRAIFPLRIGVTITERVDQVALHRRSMFRFFLRKRQFLPRQLRRGGRDDR
jgi:hypothetical protein